MDNSLTYQSKENRDQRFRELRAEGKLPQRSSMRNQLLHPQYVEDFVGPEKQDTGFGNEVYKTYFARLYMLDW